MGEIMSGLESVPSAYLSIGFLTILGIIMPLTNFAITWVVRPRVDPARPHITRSYLLEGYERDHSLYPRRLTTFECGSEPVGDAMKRADEALYLAKGRGRNQVLTEEPLPR